MKAQLEQDLKDLQKARKNNLVSADEYCSIYYSISQQIKKLNKMTTNELPIEFLYSDSEIIKLKREILLKDVITSEDLNVLREIDDYLNR